MKLKLKTQILQFQTDKQKIEGKVSQIQVHLQNEERQKLSFKIQKKFNFSSSTLN
jgi:putative aminopeptidase FrvX